MTDTSPSGPSLIRLCRVLGGLSEAKLAERAGICRETVSKIENGADPHLRTAQAVADALGIDVTTLFPVKGESPADHRALAKHADAAAYDSAS